MSRRKGRPSAEELKASLAKLVEQTKEAGLGTRARRSLEKEIQEVVGGLSALLRTLDPVAEPAAVFDPGNPKIVGRFVALALVAQERVPLSKVPSFYGAGIYALYYRGSFDAYAPIGCSETPIYVGTASPAIPNARSPTEQGTRLCERIAYHARNVGKAKSTLDLADFEFRSLVVQSGWEKQAESYLIHLFRPVWNKETRILAGFGKHGDSAEMRQHGRSPWDTLHPARVWAGDSKRDQKSETQIREELRSHFAAHPPYQTLDDVLREFLEGLSQVSS